MANSFAREPSCVLKNTTRPSGSSWYRYIWYSSVPTASGRPAAAPSAPSTGASGSVPTARPCAGRNSGSAWPKMKRKMKDTLTTMKMPPSVMTAVAARSTRLTRLMRAPAAITRSRTVAAAEAILVSPWSGEEPYWTLASSCFAISGESGR